MNYKKLMEKEEKEKNTGKYNIFRKKISYGNSFGLSKDV